MEGVYDKQKGAAANLRQTYC